jgi:hypothetical protein
MDKEAESLSYSKPPTNIFIKTDKQIIEEIQSMSSKDPETYNLFRNKFISLDISCDTISGKILSVIVEEDFDFHSYSDQLVGYFYTMGPINCAVYPVSGKVSKYYVSVGWRGNDLYLNVDYGYADEKRKTN